MRIAFVGRRRLLLGAHPLISFMQRDPTDQHIALAHNCSRQSACRAIAAAPWTSLKVTHTGGVREEKTEGAPKVPARTVRFGAAIDC